MAYTTTDPPPRSDCRCPSSGILPSAWPAGEPSTGGVDPVDTLETEGMSVSEFDQGARQAVSRAASSSAVTIGRVTVIGSPPQRVSRVPKNRPEDIRHRPARVRLKLGRARLVGLA